MSDEPLTKETISEFMHLAEAGEPRDAYIRISVERLKALCTLALRGLEAERVREEALEEAATALDGDADTWEAQARTWSMEDHDTRADYNAALLRRAAVLVRSLKKAPPMPSDATHGARVRKTTGDYTFEGVIVAWFYKRDGQTVRYVVEDDRGICLIMNRKQFEVISDAS